MHFFLKFVKPFKNNLISFFFFFYNSHSLFFFFCSSIILTLKLHFHWVSNFFLQVTFWNCSSWHIYVSMHFASPYFMFLKSDVTDFSFLYNDFFLWLRSIFLLNFFANLLFLNSLFFFPLFSFSIWPQEPSQRKTLMV